MDEHTIKMSSSFEAAKMYLQRFTTQNLLSYLVFSVLMTRNSVIRRILDHYFTPLVAYMKTCRVFHLVFNSAFDANQGCF